MQSSLNTGTATGSCQMHRLPYTTLRIDLACILSQLTWRLKGPRQSTCEHLMPIFRPIIVADYTPSLYLDSAAFHFS